MSAGFAGAAFRGDPRGSDSVSPAAGPGTGLARLLWSAGKALVRRLRAGRASAPALLSVTAKLNLGPKKSLFVIACGDRRFLVAAGGETIGAMLEIGPVRPVRRGRPSAGGRRKRLTAAPGRAR